jgi:hypothetical protein
MSELLDRYRSGTITVDEMFDALRAMDRNDPNLIRAQWVIDAAKRAAIKLVTDEAP